MTISELVNECISSIHQGCDKVTLTMPKVLKRFPRGELVSVTREGLRVMRYDAMRVLGYLKKNGLIEVEREGDRGLRIVVFKEETSEK